MKQKSDMHFDPLYSGMLTKKCKKICKIIKEQVETKQNDNTITTIDENITAEYNLKMCLLKL